MYVTLETLIGIFKEGGGRAHNAEEAYSGSEARLLGSGLV
jgi:hypothetical protein